MRYELQYTQASLVVMQLSMGPAAFFEVAAGCFRVDHLMQLVRSIYACNRSFKLGPLTNRYLRWISCISNWSRWTRYVLYQYDRIFKYDIRDISWTVLCSYSTKQVVNLVQGATSMLCLRRVALAWLWLIFTVGLDITLAYSRSTK